MRNFTKVKFWLLLMVMGLMVSSSFAQTEPKLEVSPDPLNLGEWPIGGWQEAAYLNLTNAGTGALNVNASELDDVDGVFTLSNPNLPVQVSPLDPAVMVGVSFTSDDAVDGVYTATYVASWGAAKSVTTADITVNAYTAVEGDIVENPYMVTLPYNVAGATTDLPMRSNYILPGAATNGKDVVYKFTLAEDQEVTALLTPVAETPKMALYAAGFEGEGGPMVSNAIINGGTDLTAVPLFAGDYYLVVSCEGDNAAMTYDLDITSTTMPDPMCVINAAPADGAIEVPANGSTLSWEYDQYVQEYQVLFGTDYPPTTELVAWTAINPMGDSYELPNLDPSMQYFWQVNVRNNNATVVCDVWGFTTTLTPPSELTATPTMVGTDENAYNVVLNWTGSAKALLGYNVYRDAVKINESLVTETTYTDLAVAYNMNPCYEYQVEAIFDEGVSAMSNVATACVTGTGMVEGTVTALQTGEPIEGATVVVGGYTTTTDADGNYSIEVLEDTYDYTVSMDGYITETLEDVDVAYNTTVTNDFELDEFPYPVNDVVAWEANDNTVQVDWGNNGGGGGGNVAEWLFYDDGTNVDGIGGPASFTWAIKFDADQLVDYPGSSVTKFSVFVRTAAPLDFKVMQGDDATEIYTETITGLTVDAWNEVELTTPVAFDNTQALWFGLYSADGGNYPAAVGADMGNPNSDLITLDGAVWEHLSDYGLDGAWNLRGFITDANGKSYAVNNPIASSSDYKADNTPLTAANLAPSAATATIVAPADKSAKDLMGYNVYRQVCNEATPMEFLGMTLDDQFTDNTWGTVEWGTYKWAVEVIYTNNVSEIAYSNCLDKDMLTTVGVEVSTNSGDTPEGCVVVFTNTSEPELELSYTLELDETGTDGIDPFRKGTYSYTVNLAGFGEISAEDVLIGTDTIFVWQLLEEIAAPTNLYVTPTGLATWGAADAGAGFEPYLENFDTQEAFDAWEVVVGGTSSDTWHWVVSDGGKTLDGTPFAFADSDAAGSGTSMDELLISPVINAAGQSELYLDWDQNFQHITGSVWSVKVFDGSAWVEVYHQEEDDSAWESTVHKTIDVSAYANADFQVSFQYVAPGWHWQVALDNVAVTNTAGKSVADAKALQFYKIFHDAVFSNDVLDTTFYQYGTNADVDILVPGETYMASVAALYSTGLSEFSYYEWTYLPCDSFAGPAVMEAYNVEGSDDVVVLWGDGGAVGTGEFFEDFESGALPTGWAIYDEDGDGYNWEPSLEFNAHSGVGIMYSASYLNGVGALTPNNYIVTPGIAVGGTSELSFWYAGQDAGYAAEVFNVLISTTGNTPADFTETIGDGVASGDYQEMVIDLSAYAGQTVYIAIQHTDITDMFYLNLDDVKVTNTLSKSAYTPSVAATSTGAMPFRTSGMSQAQIDSKLATYVSNAAKAAKAAPVALGTNVYREGELIAFVPAPDTFYLDNNLEAGYYDYCVATVYSEDDGDHTWTSCIDGNCEEDVLIPEECFAPINLEAIDEAGNGTVVILNWSIAGGFEPLWLQYDDGTNVDGIGGPAEFTYACKWDASQLADYDGSAVTTVKFFPREAGTAFTMKIWKGANAGTLVHEQPLSGLTFDAWNEVALTTPVEVDVTEELWVGFYVVTGGYPAGMGAYVGNPNSDLITLDGSAWEHLADYGLDGSWNLGIYLEAAKGNVVELPALVDHATYSGNATVAKGNLPASPNAVYEGTRAFTGFNVYRDGEQVNEELVLETTYTDVLPHETASYCWEVTAVYTVCGESDPSNEVCLEVFTGLDNVENNVNVYPNPATDYVMVEASSDIRSIEITNYMGQVVNSTKSVEMTQTRINTSDLSAGIYFVEVETAAGIEKVRIVISE